MPIPTVMLNDDIKASTAYAEYLTKSLGTQPATGKGKGKGKRLITKKDLEVALKNIGVQRKRRLEIVFEESAQSEGVEADTMDYEETEKEDEIPLVRRQTRVFIGKQILQQRPKGSSEGFDVTLEVPDGLNQKVLIEGSGVTPLVPNEPSGSSSSSSLDFDDEIRDIFSDDENDVATDKEKAKDKKDVEEQAGEDHTMTEQGNQFINDNPEVSLTDVLKEPKAEVQSLSGCSSSSTESS
ncbi:hypothetical protein Tco_1088241 [Tanacetum coccineum]